MKEQRGCHLTTPRRTSPFERRGGWGGLDGGSGLGPAGEQHRSYTDWLRRCGAIVTDMEASTLFIMAQTASAGHASSIAEPDRQVPVQTGCVLAVFAGADTCDQHDPVVAQLAEERAIQVALSSARPWLDQA